jgi:hypothetical protein
MGVDSFGPEYFHGQAAMVEYFASCIASLPLEGMVARLDLSEAQDAGASSSAAYTRGVRQLDRDAAAILLQAKRELLALYTAHVSRICRSPRVRDSRPSLPAPIDPTGGRSPRAEDAIHD